jgi:hypothetical protein
MKAVAVKSTSDVGPAKKQETVAVPAVAISPWIVQPTLFPSPWIQRQASCACGGDCPRCQGNTVTDGTRPMSAPDLDRQDSTVTHHGPRAIDFAYESGKHSGAAGERSKGEIRTVNDASAGSAPAVVHDALRSPGQPLPTPTRSLMESRFGYDFGQVRIHTDPQAARSAEVVNALAYTVGRNIVFGTGQFAPETAGGQKLVAHELAHVIQQSRGGPYPPSPVSSSGFESSAEQASDAVIRGEHVRVTGACAPGLARQERWLSATPNVSAMSDDVLDREIILLRQWLLDNSNSGPDSERLTAVLAMFEQESLRPSRRERHRARTTPASAPRVGARDLGSAVPLVGAAAVALPLPAGGLAGAGGVTASEITTGVGGRAVAGVLSVPLAAVATFFAILLYPSSTMSGEEEARLLEAARRRPAPGSASPGAPDLSRALSLLRNAITAISATTVLAISAEMVDRHRGKIQNLLDQIEELIRTNPRAGMVCSAELIAFRQAVRQALDYLSGPADQIDKFRLVRLTEIVESALHTLLACLGM